MLFRLSTWRMSQMWAYRERWVVLGAASFPPRPPPCDEDGGARSFFFAIRMTTFRFYVCMQVARLVHEASTRRRAAFGSSAKRFAPLCTESGTSSSAPLHTGADQEDAAFGSSAKRFAPPPPGTGQEGADQSTEEGGPEEPHHVSQ